MPCRDYDSDRIEDLRQLKIQADRLARIACKAMTALEAEGKDDFIMLQDAEVREWWIAHKIADAKEAAHNAEVERVARLAAEYQAKLAPIERFFLGIKE